ncbi:hypothetical protein [Cyanobium sp. WAJ14-Wanaka]|uniref:hypothetical protein n=1 Tax=Cyanobium sp. WAJ14-Wanaka TaxID=2823725 RepID=UPI0020CE4C5B|nr:hypothetical protein [Cyanobium sp. WAJ14-Wanaka]MCP9775986.1 hypothetical protein [Cyanobium sp. WAJ14-Wanaka]
MNRLGLALALNFSAVLTAAAQAGGFGRWETQLGSCQIEHRIARLGQQTVANNCRRMRLEQNIEGLLSARFIAPGRELIFVGSLGKGQKPMLCNGDGGCKPEMPIKLLVSTVAEAAFDNGGLARGIPHAQLARGECEVTNRSVNCQASNGEGESWHASASL